MDNFETTRENTDPSLSIPTFTSKSARAGLAALYRAYACALDAGVNVWEFALEIDQLTGVGLTINHLRWLVAKHYAVHGRETSTYGDAHRSFERSLGLNFDPDTCLVLTGDGAEFAKQMLEAVEGDFPTTTKPTSDDPGADDPPRLKNGSNGAIPSKFAPEASTKPKWIAGRRELWLGDKLVKRFRVPARNQEWILEIFEEDEWPECIDDPLPPSPDIDPKSRLHDAINRLNKKQANPVLRFHGNGNGKGVYWEVV